MAHMAYTDEIERPSQNSARATRRYPADKNELLAAVRRAADRLPRWMLRDADDAGLALVRSTRLFRFKDDIAVRVFQEEGGTRAEFESASRLGKGDLGQNPRNLQELLGALDRELG